jgi:hypothetical protein
MNQTPIRLRREFVRCMPWIQDALDRDIGTHDIDDVWAAIEHEAAQLWPYKNSAIVTTVESYPKGKALRWWLVGGDLDELLDAEIEISKWAEEQGCDLIFAGGRRGWVRTLPGYSEAYTVVFKKLPRAQKE